MNLGGATKQPRLLSLTSLRFIAAILVVFHHSTRDLVHVSGLSYLAAPGFVGVGFFFTLSGFVLTWSARLGDTHRQFFRRRFARVFPMHALTWVIVLPIVAAEVGSIAVGPAVASLLLVQAWIPSSRYYFGMNSVSWSLSCEAFFYALFPFVLPWVLRSRGVRLVRVVAGLTIACLAITLAAKPLLSGNSYLAAFYINPVYRFAEFFSGMMLATWLREAQWKPIRRNAATALFVLAWLGAAAGNSVLGRLGLPNELTWPMIDALLIPVWVIVIAACAQADLKGVVSRTQRPMFVRLGEWSFALYLVHQPIIRLFNLAGVKPSKEGAAASLLILACYLVLAVAAAGLAYHFVERPLERRLRGGPERAEAVAVG